MKRLFIVRTKVSYWNNKNLWILKVLKQKHYIMSLKVSEYMYYRTYNTKWLCVATTQSSLTRKAAELVYNVYSQFIYEILMKI